MPETCAGQGEKGRRLVSLLSAPCDLHWMNWGRRARVTSSGGRRGGKKVPQRTPASLVTATHSLWASFTSFFSPRWSLTTVFSSLSPLKLLAPLSLFPLYHRYWFGFIFFQIVICGQRDSPDTAALLAAVSSLFLPHKVSVLNSDASSWQMRVSSFARATLKRKDHRAAKTRALIYSERSTFTVAAHEQ